MVLQGHWRSGGRGWHCQVAILETGTLCCSPVRVRWARPIPLRKTPLERDDWRLNAWFVRGLNIHFDLDMFADRDNRQAPRCATSPQIPTDTL